MKITFLGTGTSTGVPMIGCDCVVCLSNNKKDTRLRSSILIETASHTILVDTSKDLRIQALTHGFKRVDMVLFTHSHADHVHGIDELRSFNVTQKGKIPCYGSNETINNIHDMFGYIFKQTQEGGGKPRLSTHVLEDPMELPGLTITPINIMHGDLSIYGYRFNDTVYLTDCSFVSEESKKFLKGVELFVVGALRHDPHPTHFSISEAIELIEECSPKRAVLTHLNHNVGFDDTTETLPSGIELAYDGMIIDGLG